MSAISSAASAAASAPAPSALRRRLDGTFEVDEWGLDPDLVDLVSPAIGLRWSVDVQWADRVPAGGPAVLVHNRRLGLSEPWVLARGLRASTGRLVRSVGIPDIAPIGPALRRLGGVLDRSDEVAGLLRAGQVVALPLDRQLGFRRHAGGLHARALAGAWESGAPVLPVAVVGRELGRSWRVLVGEPVPRPSGAGPLAVAEHVEAARLGVQELLDEAAPAGWRL